MPGYERGIRCLLDEKAAAPAQQIFSVQILDRIDDFFFPDQLVEPCEKQLGLAAKRTAQRPAIGPLEFLESSSNLARAFVCDRPIVSFVVVLQHMIYLVLRRITAPRCLIP